MKFIILSFKKNILPFIFIIFAVCLVIFSKSNLTAAKSGLSLWASNVVPALFPFFVVTELLSNTNIISTLGIFFSKIMRPIFHVPGEGTFPFIMGMISGYPVGGKIVADMRSKKLCSKDEGERLLAFTNNSGPLFIVSSVGISLFGDTKTGFLLLFTHILACITVGIILARLSIKNKENDTVLSTSYGQSNSNSSISFKDIGSILGKSIQNVTSTILLIGGFVVIFSVIISILDKTNILGYISHILSPIFKLFGFDISFAKPFLSGLIELTNGVNLISKIQIKSISQNIILCAFLLGFGGFSILLQVFSIIAHTDLSIKKYVVGKFMQGIFAAFYTFLALKLLPFLNLDITPVSVSISNAISYPIDFFGLNPSFLLLLTLFFVVLFVFSQPDKKKRKKNLIKKSNVT